MSRVKLAAHRQTKYTPYPKLNGPTVLELPEPTPSRELAKKHLAEFGVCVLTNVLSNEEIEMLRDKLDRQRKGEVANGLRKERVGKNIISNCVNKGKEFLNLVTHDVVDDMYEFLFGRQFLLHSLTASYFTGPEETPQVLHRDQGYVPATADFCTSAVGFFTLDEFTPEDGGTHIVPGSHRWPAEYLIRPPSRDLISPISAPKGSLIIWDGRVWHGTGINKTGAPRRSVGVFFALPWLRQQENWGVTTLQEVLDEASDKLKVRLGLKSYGTLGMMEGGNGTRSGNVTLGNSMLQIPEFVIGEDGKKHPMKRVSREQTL